MNTALEQIKTSISKVKELRHLNFLITETFDLAEKQCEEAIKNGKQPFEFVVKDNYAVKDVKMTCASKMLKDFIAPYTATCVQRLVDGGGCLIGKSNMDEFAMGSTCTSGYFGPVKHSIYATNQSFEDEKDGDDDFLIAGGSSGGCAVAVATGVAKCGLASDTGGSARYPAVLNGVYGFKPSYGHLSRHGLVPLANALDTPSIMTKSISDCKRYFELLKGQDPMDITTLPDNLHSQKVQPMPKNLKELTIGIPKYERTDLLSKDAEEIYQKIINLLISNGIVIKQVLLPNLEYAVNCYSVVVDVEIASNMARFDGIRYGYCINKEQLINDDSFIAYIKRNRSESLGTGVKRRIFAGNYYSLNENYNKYVNKAAKIQRLIQKDFSTIFNQNIHCILTPVSRHSAPLFSQIKRRNREEQRLEDYFMAPANLCGLPSIAIPYSQCSRGLPLGIQLIAPYLEDLRLLKISEMIEKLF
uniref:Amidase domain-containing protein n=2 Tax=Meloidogyne incognita TaxID=6306 RepID=A0A914M9B0_MELIC